MCHYSILELRSRVMHSNTISKVLLWWDSEKRDLPWRISRDPWAILVSEFMLQQTQVKTVIPYFNKFTKEIKSLKKLSSTSERKVLKLWEGLGYYRRARNLYACSNQIITLYKGKLPKTLDEIKKLPGIGDYTSNALLGLVHNKPTLALDGNVKRVFSRILNIEEKKFKSIDQFKFDEVFDVYVKKVEILNNC